MKKKLGLMVAGVLIIAAAAVGGAYYISAHRLTGQQLYETALDNALKENTHNLYGSVSVESANTTMKGELSGNLASNNYKFRGDLKQKTDLEGTPISVSLETVMTQNGEQSEQYMRYKSVTSSDQSVNAAVAAIFKPTLDKWVKAEPSDDDSASTFETEGALASMDIFDIFAPVAALSQPDQSAYLQAVDKYELYSVNKQITPTRYKGVAARQIRVSINKDALLEFDSEVSQSLSKAANYQRLDSQFVDEFFAGKDTYAANVYINDANKIIGVALDIDLKQPVTEQSFSSKVDKVSASMLFEYDRPYTITEPAGAISEDEFNNLLGQSMMDIAGQVNPSAQTTNTTASGQPVIQS